MYIYIASVLAVVYVLLGSMAVTEYR